MSELIIFGYDDHATAERAYERVLELQADYVVSLSGLATVRIDEDGKKHIDTPARIMGATVVGGLVGRLLGFSVPMGIAIGLTALFGFPGDYMICLEIARSVARTEEERTAIMGQIYSPMLVGGFATVTTSSVVVASVLVSTL